MKSETIWAILCLILGASAAIFFSPRIGGSLGWPVWLAFIVIFVDVALVLYVPLTIREYYASFRLYQSGSPQNRLGGDVPPRLLLLTFVFVVAPIAVLIWMISRPPNASEFTHQVKANQGWQDTRISVASGDQVVIEYVSGLWFTAVEDGGGHDASGGPNAWTCTAPECHEPLHDFPKYALIGKVGNSGALLRVGNGLGFTAESSGILYLRPNYGDVDIRIHNPEGAITVKVTIR